MNDKLIEAFFDAPHTVLKRRLKPFTLRHAFVLSAGDNFIIEDGDPSVGDLYQAVEVCSRDSKYFFSDKAPSFIQRWWHEKRCKKLDILTEFESFQAYLEDYMAGPSVWSKDEGGGKGSKCNWIISTVVSLMKLGMTKDDAFDTPPGQAMWLLVSAMESDPNVNIDIMSDKEVEAVEYLKGLPDEPALTPEQEDTDGNTD